MVYIKVTCPCCGHENTAAYDGGYSPRIYMCDDPADGGCGEYFVYRVIRIETRSFKIAEME